MSEAALILTAINRFGSLADGDGGALDADNAHVTILSHSKTRQRLRPIRR